MEKTQFDIKPWLEATRPKTLAASIIPVLIGTSAASMTAKIEWHLVALILICAVLIQIFTNFINEVYDFKRGADREDRLGPRRQVAAGSISAKSMTIVAIFILIITFSLGMIVVAHSGITIFVIGVLSLIFAFAYTGGPYPLAYNGLGDLFVFIFFGLAAVCGTYFVFTGTIDGIALLASLPPGLLSSNILGVNNIRDISTDPQAGKITLAVKVGRPASIRLYQLMNFAAYASSIQISYLTNNLWAMLPILSLPLAIKLNSDISSKHGTELNATLADTGKLLFVFGLLMVIGFLVG